MLQNQRSLSGSERESSLRQINRQKKLTLPGNLILPPQKSDQVSSPWPWPWLWHWPPWSPSYSWSTWLNRSTNLLHNTSNTGKEAGFEFPPFDSQCQVCQEICSTSTSTSTHLRNNPNHHHNMATELLKFQTHCDDYSNNTNFIAKCLNPAPQEKVAAAASLYPPITHAGKDHMRTTHHPPFKINLFKCELCPELFMEISFLRRHWETHILGEKAPHMCPLCNRWFMSKDYALRHLRLHMGDSPHKCDNCGRQFLSHANLKSHMNTHANNFQFTCTACGAFYKRACHFNRHIKTCRGNRSRLAKKIKKFSNNYGNEERG